MAASSVRDPLQREWNYQRYFRGKANAPLWQNVIFGSESIVREEWHSYTDHRGSLPVDRTRRKVMPEEQTREDSGAWAILPGEPSYAAGLLGSQASRAAVAVQS